MAKKNRPVCLRTARLGFSGAIFALLLAGCARPTAPAPVPPDLPQTGAVSTGVIMAVRQADTSLAGGGLAGVLNALNQPAPATRAMAQEIVLRRQDGNIVTLMQAQPAGFSVGDSVVIIAGDPATLAHGN